MRFRHLIHRLATIAIAALACAWIASRVGAWAALGLWAAGVLILCGGVGVLMHRQTSGTVGPINHVAAYVLPWGFAIGRGKLLPIVIESSLRWLLLGIGVVLATHPSRAATSPASLTSSYHRPDVVMTILLVTSWLIDGAVVLRLLTVTATRSGSHPIAPGILAVIIGVSALIIASAALSTLGNSIGLKTLALLLTGGPIVVIGVGYGLFVLMLVTVGRKARWN